jgi:xylulokinase
MGWKHGADRIQAKVIRAGKANMFLSPIFRETLAGISGATIELYNTDGSIGAARGAGIGSGYYASAKEAFANLNKLETVEPDLNKKAQYEEAYLVWKSALKKVL